MRERVMEDLIADYPDEFFHRKKLVLKGRQQSFPGVGRFDLLFEDEFGTTILMELKARPAKMRDAEQLARYANALHAQGTTGVVMHLVAPLIGTPMRDFMDRFGIEYSEIHEPEFRAVAARHGRSVEPDGPAPEAKPAASAQKRKARRTGPPARPAPTAGAAEDGGPEPADIQHKMILIRINQRYRTAMERFRGKERDRALLEATRGVWRVGPRRENADYAAAVYKGIIREVYRIHRWHPAGTLRYETRGDVRDPNRWEFEGEVATDVRGRYVGRSVFHHLTPHNANPIVYVNVEQT